MMIDGTQSNILHPFLKDLCFRIFTFFNKTYENLDINA